MRASSCTGKHSEPTRSPDRSGVNREVHAPFCERPEVKSLGPTHPSASTKMARLYGRAPKGERCLAAVPHGHWKTTTFTAGLRIGGLAAPFVLDGPMDGSAFRAYLTQVLVPELKPGDVVIMDNLP